MVNKPAEFRPRVLHVEPPLGYRDRGRAERAKGGEERGESKRRIPPIRDRQRDPDLREDATMLSTGGLRVLLFLDAGDRFGRREIQPARTTASLSTSPCSATGAVGLVSDISAASFLAFSSKRRG